MEKKNRLRFILRNGIKTVDELCVKAGERLEAGEPDVFDFLSKTQTKHVEELITRMWDFKKATDRATDPVLSRIEKLKLVLEKGCDADCNGRW